MINKLIAIMFLMVFQQLCVAADNSKLKVEFKPKSPIYHTKTTTFVQNTEVYDHSKFSVKLTNRYRKTLHMKGVIFKSFGDKQISGLGDIVNKWPWKRDKSLKPGKSISFTKVWGFIQETPNQKMTYQFIFTYSLGENDELYNVTKDLVLKPE